MNTQEASLNGQISSLNTQLSAQASAKEKAEDQDTVLTQAVNAESNVSAELNTCVSDMQAFLSTLSTDLGDGYGDDPNLEDQAQTAHDDCLQAQTDNNALQASLSGSDG